MLTTPPMNDAFQAISDALPPAHDAMQDFSWFIGEWNIESKMLQDAANDVWLTEQIHSEHSYIMGGHVIFEHFYGTLGGEALEAWSLRKYNAQIERWEQCWIDTSSPMMVHWGGTFDESGQYTGYAKRFLNEAYEIAGEQASREVFFNVQKNSFSWKFERTTDSGQTWTAMWTLEYTRR